MCWALIDPWARPEVPGPPSKISLCVWVWLKSLGSKSVWIYDSRSSYVALIESRLGETATFVFFGVFDGHGGPYCAEHVVLTLQKDSERQFSTVSVVKQVDFFFSNLRKTLEISGKPCFIKWDPVKSSEFLVHAESTHLAKNILARLRDRARNVSDEAMNYPLKITPVESTCEYSLSSYKI